MAGSTRGRGRGGYKNANPKLVGRGILESVATTGPFNDWVGMPQYYIHMLTVDAQEYSYQSLDKTVEIELGKKVTFRYRETAKGQIVDKNSLGVVIDPSELM